jgi:hypothetical protein
MEEEFIPYELAVKLKALGFDEPCFGRWWFRADMHKLNEASLEIIRSNYFELPEHFILAPTFSQAFRWFREKYSLYSHIRESYAFDNTLGFVSQINGSCVTHGIVDKPINRFDTYEEAELACLTKLIEIVETRTK